MQINPRLRRADVMLNSFSSCISNTPEEFSRAPEMPVLEIISQPRMLSHQLESTIPFEQLQCFADRHCWRQLNKQMHMVNSNMKLVDFTIIFDCNLADESFTINLQPKKLEGIHSIFNFPDKMESILSEGMFKTFQIHFFAPKTLARNKVHTKFVNLFHEEGTNPLYNQELNINKEDGNSSLCLKAEVSLPWM